MQSKETASSLRSPAAADTSTKAKGRWKLLRAALLGEAIPDEARSIHQFPGYSSHLISSKPCEEVTDRIKELENALKDEEQDEEQFALTVWALLAFDPKRSLWTLPIVPKFHQERLIRWLSPHSCQFQSDSHLLVTPHVDTNDVQVKCYPFPHSTVYARERSRTARKSLHELTSHHQAETAAIDNTGNICVWDCEIVLAWFLWQPGAFRIAQGSTLLEVGGGMAAMNALAGDGVCSHIFITDGHADCVWNNRINVRLLRHANPMSVSHIQCSVLRWSYDDDDTLLCSADSTLVSDCTHFEEWHGQLLWTILRHTRVGGSIWMCQPNRGQSWSRFQHLIECTVLGTVASLQEHSSDQLDQLHAQFLSDHSSSYEPDRHQPRIFQISKLQEVTGEHRNAIQEHIRNRE